MQRRCKNRIPTQKRLESTDCAKLRILPRNDGGDTQLNLRSLRLRTRFKMKPNDAVPNKQSPARERDVQTAGGRALSHSKLDPWPSSGGMAAYASVPFFPPFSHTHMQWSKSITTTTIAVALSISLSMSSEPDGALLGWGLSKKKSAV